MGAQLVDLSMPEIFTLCNCGSEFWVPTSNMISIEKKKSIAFILISTMTFESFFVKMEKSNVEHQKSIYFLLSDVGFDWFRIV